MYHTLQDVNRDSQNQVTVAAFPLKHLKAAEAARMLQGLLGEKDAFVGVDARDNAVLVRTTERHMATVRSVLTKVDMKDK
jgi:hypothetical protein